MKYDDFVGILFIIMLIAVGIYGMYSTINLYHKNDEIERSING